MIHSANPVRKDYSLFLLDSDLFSENIPHVASYLPGIMDKKILAARDYTVLLPAHGTVGHMDAADQVHPAPRHGGVPVPSQYGAKNQHFSLPVSDR